MRKHEAVAVWSVRVAVACIIIAILAAVAWGVGGCKTSYGLGGDLMDVSRPFIEHRDEQGK